MTFFEAFPTQSKRADPHDRDVIIGASVDIIANPPVEVSDSVRDALAAASCAGYNPSYHKVTLTEVGRVGTAQHLRVEASATTGADAFLSSYVETLGRYAAYMIGADAPALQELLTPREQ